MIRRPSVTGALDRLLSSDATTSSLDAQDEAEARRRRAQERLKAAGKKVMRMRSVLRAMSEVHDKLDGDEKADDTPTLAAAEPAQEPVQGQGGGNTDEPEDRSFASVRDYFLNGNTLRFNCFNKTVVAELRLAQADVQMQSPIILSASCQLPGAFDCISES